MSDNLGQSRRGSLSVIRTGLRHSPEVLVGLWFTLLLSVIGTAGGTLIPIVIKRVLDDGLGTGGDLDPHQVRTWVLAATALLIVIAVTGYWSKVRIFTAAEAGLSTLRVTAFRHVHDLSTLTQTTQRRGALVSRVTSDVDQVSQFLQFGGILLIVSSGQMLLALIVMATMSWQLTLVVIVTFVPLVLGLRYLADAMSRAYERVRASVGMMLAFISEPIVGAGGVTVAGYASRYGRVTLWIGAAAGLASALLLAMVGGYGLNFNGEGMSDSTIRAIWLATHVVAAAACTAMTRVWH